MTDEEREWFSHRLTHYINALEEIKASMAKELADAKKPEPICDELRYVVLDSNGEFLSAMVHDREHGLCPCFSGDPLRAHYLKTQEEADGLVAELISFFKIPSTAVRVRASILGEQTK